MVGLELDRPAGPGHRILVPSRSQDIPLHHAVETDHAARFTDPDPGWLGQQTTLCPTGDTIAQVGHQPGTQGAGVIPVCSHELPIQGYISMRRLGKIENMTITY